MTQIILEPLEWNAQVSPEPLLPKAMIGEIFSNINKQRIEQRNIVNLFTWDIPFQFLCVYIPATGISAVGITKELKGQQKFSLNRQCVGLE